MKHPKPGFNVFLKTRLRNPTQFKSKLIYVSATGEKFIDVGSEITTVVLISLSYIFLYSFVYFSFRIWGILIWIFVPALHRFLRYFWTDFVKLDEENNPIEDSTLLKERKIWKKPKYIIKLLKIIRKDYDEEKVRYKRYSVWQKALIFLIMPISFALFFGAAKLLEGTPYVRNYYYPSVHTQINNSQPIDNIVQAYEKVQPYIDERIPEAELVGYSICIDKSDTVYKFRFRNPKRGTFIRDSIEMADITLSVKENSFTCDYSDITPKESVLNTIAIPVYGLDITRIIEIARQEAGMVGVWASFVDRFLIEPSFSDHASRYNYDPGGKTWAVRLMIEDYELYYTVDIEKSVAIREE